MTAEIDDPMYESEVVIANLNVLAVAVVALIEACARQAPEPKAFLAAIFERGFMRLGALEFPPFPPEWWPEIRQYAQAEFSKLIAAVPPDVQGPTH